MGDVSGKGLKAAMTVSLIVRHAAHAGRLHAAAGGDSARTEPPADRPHRRRLRDLRGAAHRGQRGDDSGERGPSGAISATAKKLAGERARCRSGLSGHAVYDELTFRLQEDETPDRVYTDGIVEARNSRGELFGFDRLSELLATHPDVGKIVDAAESFGQEDDITAVSITRHPVGERKAATVSLTAQIATA